MRDFDIKIDLSDFKAEFSHDMKYLREYLDFNEDKLQERAKNLKQLLSADLEEDPKSESILIRIYEEDGRKTPSYFYHSSINSLFSLLEYALNNLCTIIIENTKISITLDELAGGNYVTKAKSFLKNFPNVRFDHLDKQWIQITKYQRLRNLIVHQNSILKFDPVKGVVSARDYPIVKEFKKILIDEINGRFYINDISIIAGFYEAIDTFIRGIADQIEEMNFRTFHISDRYNDWYPTDDGPGIFSDDLPF